MNLNKHLCLHSFWILFFCLRIIYLIEVLEHKYTHGWLYHFNVLFCIYHSMTHTGDSGEAYSDVFTIPQAQPNGLKEGMLNGEQLQQLYTDVIIL